MRTGIHETQLNVLVLGVGGKRQREENVEASGGVGSEIVDAFAGVPPYGARDGAVGEGERSMAPVQAEGAAAYSVLWPEMYKEAAFTERRGFGARNYPFDDPANMGAEWSKTDCPVAREMATATIAFWTHPTYTMRHIAADVRAFENVAAAYMKK